MIDKNMGIVQDEIDKFLWELKEKYSIRDKIMVWVLLRQVMKYYFRDIAGKDEIKGRDNV